MSIQEYEDKRNFKSTPEPSSSSKSSSKSGSELIFVVQRHAASRLHYDFRLEVNGVLKSWAIPKGPSLNPSDKRLAIQVEDHPFSYRNFEGSIPKGNYGAGEVEIWDEGTYEPLSSKNLQDDSIKIKLNGIKLKGEFALVKIKNSAEKNAWLLIKHDDEFATHDEYNAEDYVTIQSKVTHHLNRKNKSKAFIKPMLCKVAEKVFDDEEWAFEIKWDGYRAIADLRNDQIKFYSRNGIDFSNRFRKITNALKFQNHELILDGEIVAFDDAGKPNFQWLQNEKNDANLVLVYQVFDLLWLNGHSTEGLNYLQRKELLKDALVESEQVVYHDHIIGKGRKFFKEVQKLELEGIIAKKTDSIYRQGIRSSEWLKIKTQKTDEVIIAGYTEPKAGRIKFGSLILGKYKDGKLIFVGHTGSGFNDKSLIQLHKKLEKIKTDTCPFEKTPKTNDKPNWVKPKLVAEIKFTELTQNNSYRHPVFLKLREDLDPKDIQFPSNDPKTQSKQVKQLKQLTTITNPKKIYFPEDGITKEDVIEYYQKISNIILPYLKNRPQSLHRYPNGIHELSFFQKDAGSDTPSFVHSESIYSESTDKYIEYILCNNKSTLSYLNNLGCIELNIWSSRIQKLTHPDYLVLDLDPSEKNTFEDVIETAQAVEEILKIGKIKGFPKTSGSTGMHIYIPMNAKYTYEQVKNFGNILMHEVQNLIPDLTTLERSLGKRPKNKIYLDYLQNRWGQTLASPYCIRPKKGAPVSMPLEWKEIKAGLKPEDFNFYNAHDRIAKKGDLFKPVLGKGIDILKSIKYFEQQTSK